jgi:hypothetical protein
MARTKRTFEQTINDNLINKKFNMISFSSEAQEIIDNKLKYLNTFLKKNTITSIDFQSK